MRRGDYFESAGRGAFWGAVTWGAYAVVESAFLTLRPLLQHYADYVTPAHVRWSLIFWLIYLGIGLIAGALGGLMAACLRSGGTCAGRQRYQAAAAFSLASAFLANELWAGSIDPAHGETAALAVGCGLSATALAAFLRPRAARWLSLGYGPWTLSFVLVGAATFAAPHSNKLRLALLAATLTVALLTRLWLDPTPGAAAVPRRHAWALAAAALALLCAIALSTRDLPPLPDASGPPTPRRPNIVLVVLDTVRADHMSVYGYGRRTTPFLETLARQSTLYAQAVAPSNFTLPSHASLFTGLYPRSHGAIVFPPSSTHFHPLDSSFETLAEILRSRGYRTLAATANAAFINADYGFSQGFEVFSRLRPVSFLPLVHHCHLRFGIRRALAVSLHPQRLDESWRDAAGITSDALALLRKAALSGRPLFLFLNYMDAHEPYVIPPPFDAMFPGRNPRLTYEDYERTVREVVGGRRPISENERSHFVSQYDGAIALLDRELERLTAGLREAGLWENTMLIVTSDHGEAFGEHQFVGHVQSLYQDQLFIPLLIRYPGRVSGQTVRVPVSLVDLAPTILETAGIPVPRALPGRSLLRAEQLDGRPVFAEANADPEVARLRPRHPHVQFAVFFADRKLIVSQGAGEELYDLRRDPAEATNLITAEQHKAKTLRRALDVWLEQTPLRAISLKQADPKAIERLRNFGYLR